MSEVEEVDPAHAAGERDAYGSMVDLASKAGEHDPYELRMGARDALNAARWATAANAADSTITSYLALAGQFVVAVHASVTDNHLPVPLAGRLMPVRAGLPGGALTTGTWADAIWAATCALDVPTALRIAGIETGSLVDDAPAGELELGRALAGLWNGDGTVGAHLIAALEATDPSMLGDADLDRALDLVVPTVSLFQQLAGNRDAEAINDALREAVERFVAYWASEGGQDPEGFLALRLSGLAVLASQLGVDIAVSSPVLPTAVMHRSPAMLVLCAVCAQPYDVLQERCAWCGANLAADAPLESPLGAWIASARTPCDACGVLRHPLAVRCINGHQR